MAQKNVEKMLERSSKLKKYLGDKLGRKKSRKENSRVTIQKFIVGYGVYRVHRKESIHR